MGVFALDIEAAVPFAGTAAFFIGSLIIFVCLNQFHKSEMLLVCRFAAACGRPQRDLCVKHMERRKVFIYG
jgi:hypothetical protein